MRIITTISQVTIALLFLLYPAPASAKSNLVSFDYPGALNTLATPHNLVSAQSPVDDELRRRECHSSWLSCHIYSELRSQPADMRAVFGRHLRRAKTWTCFVTHPQTELRRLRKTRQLGLLIARTPISSTVAEV